MLKLSKSIALVTGSSSGLGKVIADTLLTNSIQPIYHSRIKHNINVEACKYLIGDLSIEEEVDKIYNQSKEANILICCAGRTHLYPTHDTPLTMSKEECDKIFNNIVHITTLICKKFVPQMMKKKNGKIIIIGGDVVDHPNERGEMCCYAMAKAAIHQYVLYLSNMLRSYNINVNCVAPTKINVSNTNTLIRHVNPQEVANVVHMLCKDSFINGQIIRVNGGKY